MGWAREWGSGRKGEREKGRTDENRICGCGVDPNCTQTRRFAKLPLPCPLSPSPPFPFPVSRLPLPPRRLNPLQRREREASVFLCVRERQSERIRGVGRRR